MIKSLKELRKRIKIEFKKYRFEPGIKSYYEKDEILAKIQYLLFEWSTCKNGIK